MKPIKPVKIPKGSFAFCRYGLAIIPWIALIFQIKWLILLGLLILLLSAILKVGRAPMILIYSYTINKLFPSTNVILDENAMFFAHIFGTILFAIAAILLYYVNNTVGWIFVAFVAIAKTIGALGFCAASKLYGCMNNSGGTCCQFSKNKFKKC